MTTSKRHLPMIVETSVRRIGLLRVQLMDEFNRKVRFNKSFGTVTCSAGCAWCCHHPVSISILEGVLLYRWLVRNGKWTSKLKEELKRTSELQFGLTPEVWLKALIPCPLLTPENKCLAYSVRPLICQAYYAVSDPHYCHPHRIAKGVTTLVPRSEVTDPFHREQEALLRKHKLQLITLPIGAALLMAEKICTEEVPLEAIDGVILKEYGDKV